MDYLKRNYISLSTAIGTLSKKFENLCIPIRTNFYYDLVGEKESCMFKIKIITTDCKQPSGSYIANIRKSGGYLDKKEAKENFNNKFCDFLFIYAPECSYLIPSSKVTTKRSITLSQFEEFKIIPG